MSEHTADYDAGRLTMNLSGWFRFDALAVTPTVPTAEECAMSHDGHPCGVCDA